MRVSRHALPSRTFMALRTTLVHVEVLCLVLIVESSSQLAPLHFIPKRGRGEGGGTPGEARVPAGSVCSGKSAV